MASGQISDSIAANLPINPSASFKFVPPPKDTENLDCLIRAHDSQDCSWTPQRPNEGFRTFDDVKKHAIYYHGLKCNHCQEVLKTQAQYVHHFKLNNRCKKAPRAPQVGKRQRKRTSKLFVTDIVGTENVLEFLEVTRSGSDTNAWFDAYEALFGSESRPSEKFPAHLLPWLNATVFEALPFREGARSGVPGPYQGPQSHAPYSNPAGTQAQLPYQITASNITGPHQRPQSHAAYQLPPSLPQAGQNIREPAQHHTGQPVQTGRPVADQQTQLAHNGHFAQPYNNSSASLDALPSQQGYASNSLGASNPNTDAAPTGTLWQQGTSNPTQPYLGSASRNIVPVSTQRDPQMMAQNPDPAPLLPQGGEHEPYGTRVPTGQQKPDDRTAPYQANINDLPHDRDSWRSKVSEMRGWVAQGGLTSRIEQLGLDREAEVMEAIAPLLEWLKVLLDIDQRQE